MYGKLAGPARRMLYLIAGATGLRASELASLTPESFDLAAAPPAVVAPKDAKELARHSSITLTMDRYAHIGLTETAAAVGLLPAVAAPGCLRLHGVRATGGNRGPRVAVRRPKTDRRARAEND